MSEFTLSEWIAAAPQTIFESLSSPELAPQIMDNIQEMVQLTDGDVRKGTRFRETRLVNGKMATTELEVTRYEPPTAYSVTAVQQGVAVTYHYVLRPENDGTQIELLCEISASGLKKVMTPLIAAVMKREDGDHLQKLKHFFEAATA